MSNLYDKDFYGWTQQQAALLKEHRWAELDMKNLIEEIESLGRSEERELENRLTVLLAHLLKWRYLPNRRGKSWRLTIKGQRIDVQKIIDENPSLAADLDEYWMAAYTIAVLKAAKATGLDEDQFPNEPPFSVDQALDPEFWPN